MGIATINPFTNKTVQSFTEDSPEKVEKALATAEAAFASWRRTGYKERANLLHKVAAIMRDKKAELAKLITTEMGKLVAESVGEIELSAAIFDYYGENAARLLADQPVKTARGEALIRHSPIGVLLGVEPWNFPFYQVARFAAPNVMIGNAVLVKHASNVPQCGIAIEATFRESGAPAGLYTNLLISGKRVAGLWTIPASRAPRSPGAKRPVRAWRPQQARTSRNPFSSSVEATPSSSSTTPTSTRPSNGPTWGA